MTYLNDLKNNKRKKNQPNILKLNSMWKEMEIQSISGLIVVYQHLVQPEHNEVSGFWRQIRNFEVKAAVSELYRENKGIANIYNWVQNLSTISFSFLDPASDIFVFWEHFQVK